MTRLTEAEREALYSPIGNDEAYPELPGVVEDIIAARVVAALEQAELAVGELRMISLLDGLRAIEAIQKVLREQAAS